MANEFHVICLYSVKITYRWIVIYDNGLDFDFKVINNNNNILRFFNIDTAILNNYILFDITIN